MSWKKGDDLLKGASEGELNGGTQISTLTVTSPQEDTEYTCVVTSGKYPSSQSTETTVSLNVYCESLSKDNFNRNHYNLFGKDRQTKVLFTFTVVFSAVEALSKEVLINTETAITCKITDITDKISVEWSGFQEGENYVTSPGSYDSTTNSQSGTLTVKSVAVTSDRTYTCTVSSLRHTDSADKVLEVHLNVYSK